MNKGIKKSAYERQIISSPDDLLKHLLMDANYVDDEEAIRKRFFDEAPHHPQCLTEVHSFWFQMNYEIAKKLLARDLERKERDDLFDTSLYEAFDNMPQQVLRFLDEDEQTLQHR